MYNDMIGLNNMNQSLISKQEIQQRLIEIQYPVQYPRYTEYGNNLVINNIYPNSFCPMYNPLNYAMNTVQKTQDGDVKDVDVYTEMDRIIFPENPIREWSLREVDRIQEKYKVIFERYDRLIEIQERNKKWKT